MLKESVINLKGVTKSYKDRIAVRGIDLDVLKGECLGILGPNGAGKTSTMRMMYCNTEVTSGEIFVLGLNVKHSGKEIKGRIGVVPQADFLDQEFNVFENLLIYASFFGISNDEAIKKAQSLIMKMRLEDHKEASVESLSGGMKRRLTIARALMNDPEILFLDEPTTGLDPQSRLWIWNFLQQYKAEGNTVVLTTHYIEEAESICDRIIVIDQGKIIAAGEPKELIQIHFGKRVLEFEVQPADVNYYLNRLREMNLPYQMIGQSVIVPMAPEQDSKLLDQLISSEKMSIRKPTLNDVFLKLTGHGLRDEGHES
jgi:lipooligosaccharide transport system ATP-binding protein